MSIDQLYPVSFLPLTQYDVEECMQGWEETFDWSAYFDQPGIATYKMVVTGINEIQGAIAIEDRRDHIYVHLVESAPHNRGVDRVFYGIGPRLFAFACAVSHKCGYDGFVSFDAKAQLIDYYSDALGAQRIGHTRMIIDPVAAYRLVRLYLTYLER